jgi:hypothetical protein
MYITFQLQCQAVEQRGLEHLGKPEIDGNIYCLLETRFGIFAGKTERKWKMAKTAFILGAADLLIPLRGSVKSSTVGESPGLRAQNIISTSSASLPDDEVDDDYVFSQGSMNSLSSSNSSSDSSSIIISSISSASGHFEYQARF